MTHVRGFSVQVSVSYQLANWFNWFDWFNSFNWLG